MEANEEDKINIYDHNGTNAVEGTHMNTLSSETIDQMHTANESPALSTNKLTEKMADSKGTMQENRKYSDPLNIQDDDSEDPDNPHVLDPDNPLMIRFQKALRDLLEKQLNKLNDEVLEMRSCLKSKAREREDLGVNLFNIQEEVNHGQKQLASHNKLLAELDETRATLEEQVHITQDIYKEETNKLSAMREQEENLRLEIEYLKNFECQLKQWESDYDSELKVSQLIADKTEKQKEDMAKEKQKQDILLLRLRQAVLGLESKREQLSAQKEVKLKQQESLRKTIAEGSADLEALQSEQLRLTRIWNGVVISLQQRDRVFNNVQSDLKKAKEAFQLMLSEIEGYKRVNKQEMIQSEKAMNIHDRLETEHNDLMKTFTKNKELVSELEAEYSYFSGILMQTEKSLQSALTDGKVLLQQSNYQQRELEHLTQRKLSLEMQILEKLQDQSKHDKAFQHHVRTIKTLKDSNKTQEMSFIMMENQIAKTMVEVEKTRGAVVNNENLLKEAIDEGDKCSRELAQLEATMKQSLAAMQNKMLLNDQLTKKLDSIVSRSGITEESPQEVRMKAIEMEIEEAAQEAEKKQAFWLRLQSHIVRLSEERQKQLQELNLLYKQVHILTQRALKIEHETDRHKRGRKDVEQQIHDLDLSLNKMTNELHKKRGYKENLDKGNALLQSESLHHLKDMERENVEQEEDLANLEENNLMLNQEILDLKRECLAWEKKILLASETKQMNEEDNKATGELSQMKVEIHRMDVRFSHLRKVQDTLVKDLEHCIMRRESLLDEADAREKRSATNFVSVSNRIVFERKLENLSNRTKQAKMESRNLVSMLENELPNELLQSQAALKEAEKTLQAEQCAVSDGKKKVDDAYFMKQQKLDLLVRLQKKVRLYTKVKEGKHKLLFRTESAMEAELCKQRTACSDLLELIAVLQQHCPSLQMQIKRLQSILQASNV